MKEFLDAMLARVKSPLLGLTSSLYLFINMPLIVKFFVVDKTQKLAILDNYQFDFLLLFKCFVITTLYIIVSDWIQVLIDRAVMKARETRNAINYNSKSRLAGLEYRSTKEYQEKLVDRELEDWTSKKEECETQIVDLKKQLAVVEKNLEMYKTKVLFLEGLAEEHTKSAVRIDRAITLANDALLGLEEIFSIKNDKDREFGPTIPPRDKDGFVFRLNDAQLEFAGSKINQLRNGLTEINQENNVPLIKEE